MCLMSVTSLQRAFNLIFLYYYFIICLTLYKIKLSIGSYLLICTVALYICVLDYKCVCVRTSANDSLHIDTFFPTSVIISITYLLYCMKWMSLPLRTTAIRLYYVSFGRFRFTEPIKNHFYFNVLIFIKFADMCATTRHII